MASESLDNEDSEWLRDAEVRYFIDEVKGRWQVSLQFIDTKNPKRFFIKTIGDYHSEKLAIIYAENITKTVAKDGRGTQKVKKDAYDINDN
jgi:hypothetical protein